MKKLLLLLTAITVKGYAADGLFPEIASQNTGSAGQVFVSNGISDGENTLGHFVSPTTLGVVGPQGVAGVAGPQGTAGVTGAAGAVGAKGNQGIQGVQGVMGVNGVTGSAGTAGAKGAMGSQGMQGKDGANGKDGKDASDLTQVGVMAELDLYNHPRVDIGLFGFFDASHNNLAQGGIIFRFRPFKTELEKRLEKLEHTLKLMEAR